jgi:hypothetical protein
MHRRLSVQYGNSVTLQHIVCEVIERLKNGRASVQHEEGAGRPFTSIALAKTEQVRDMVLQNRCVAHQLLISHGSAYETIHNRLAFIKSAHDASQSNSKNCSNRKVWMS